VLSVIYKTDVIVMYFHANLEFPLLGKAISFFEVNCQDLENELIFTYIVNLWRWKYRLGLLTTYLCCGMTSVGNGQRKGDCKILEIAYIRGCHD
jgi:hypothetical protein